MKKEKALQALIKLHEKLHPWSLSYLNPENCNFFLLDKKYKRKYEKRTKKNNRKES